LEGGNDLAGITPNHRYQHGSRKSEQGKGDGNGEHWLFSFRFALNTPRTSMFRNGR